MCVHEMLNIFKIRVRWRNIHKFQQVRLPSDSSIGKEVHSFETITNGTIDNFWNRCTWGAKFEQKLRESIYFQEITKQF